MDFQQIADDMLLSKYSKAGIVVDAHGEIVYLRGNTLEFLEQPTGKPTNNLIKMAKHGLGEELSGILQKIKNSTDPIKTGNIQLQVNGKSRNISIEGLSLPGNSTLHYLLIFHFNEDPVHVNSGIATKKTGRGMKTDQYILRIQQLEAELLKSKAHMRSLADEQDAVNEQLQSTNEEMQCTSEELQSLNDELEASKEELQSSNEALKRLNDELVIMNERITTGRLYAEAIIATVREPMLVLDKHLRIKAANKAFYRTFQVNELETEGVLIYDLGNKQWNIPKLHTLLEDILPKKTNITDYEVTHCFPTIGERVMELNASEILREKEDEKLILLSIEDITEQAQLHLREKEVQKKLEENVLQRTFELSEANEELQLQNEEIALGKYNRRFLTEFSEKFPAYAINNEFFKSLTQFIADTTKLDYVFAGKLIPDGKDGPAIQTIGLTEFGKPRENIQYAIPNGPCEQVMNNTRYVFAKKCKRQFPLNEMIEQFDVEGYIAYPLNNEQGKAIGIIAVMHSSEIEDIETVLAMLKIVAKRAEIELERIRHEDKLVQNNLALEEKNDELVKMNKELQAFTFISSHDLQEPLRKIKTFSQLIFVKESDNLSEKGKDYLTRVSKAAYHMQRLIIDLLNYSQTNTSERILELTDLNTIIDEVKNELQELIEKNNAVIDTYGLGMLNIVPFQFRQLFNNLISNSIKFCLKEKAPHICIIAKTGKGNIFVNEALSDEREYCHITVADNGIGFNPEYKDKIFEIFQRLHSKEEFPGTGIGLAIVKKIIDNHHVIISATGILEEGTTFNIYIPVT